MAQRPQSYSEAEMTRRLQDLYLRYNPLGYRTPNYNPVELAANALNRYVQSVEDAYDAPASSAGAWRTMPSMAEMFDNFIQLEQERIKQEMTRGQTKKNVGQGLKGKKTLLSNQLAEPANNSAQLKRHKKAVKASERGPNSNKANAKWNVQFQGQNKMSGTAKQIAPYVTQLTGVGTSQIIARLKSGAMHSFPNDITVSLAAKYVGQGVFDWLTKMAGNSSIFKSDGQVQAPTTVLPVKSSFPADTKTLYQMNKNAYDNNCHDVNDWKCLKKTKLLQFYNKGNNIIVCVRGTASVQDLMADVKIVFQNVTESARFLEDVETIKRFQMDYPRTQYNYYFTGHSLGGALIDEFLKMGFGTSAISFNPAVQKEFYNSTNHHRIYNTQDPIYDLMGKHVPTAEVRQYQGPNEQGFFSRFLNAIPIIGDASKALKGHSLDNYIGGMKRIMPSVVDRPYMRGAGPGLYGSGMSGGFSFMDDLLKPVARFAIKGTTLGSVDPEQVFKGNVQFNPSNILPYVMKSGQNLLSAKMGDPSGLIEQGVETAKGNGRCRWVDKGSRYADWQEVCD